MLGVITTRSSRTVALLYGFISFHHIYFIFHSSFLSVPGTVIYTVSVPF